jgi:hypothetical protein
VCYFNDNIFGAEDNFLVTNRSLWFPWLGEGMLFLTETRRSIAVTLWLMPSLAMAAPGDWIRQARLGGGVIFPGNKPLPK